jgi:hypothetical protein
VRLQEFLDGRRLCLRLYRRLDALKARCRRLYHDRGVYRSEQLRPQSHGRTWRPIWRCTRVFCVALVPDNGCYRFQMHRGGLGAHRRRIRSPTIFADQEPRFRWRSLIGRSLDDSLAALLDVTARFWLVSLPRMAGFTDGVPPLGGMLLLPKMKPEG